MWLVISTPLMHDFNLTDSVTHPIDLIDLYSSLNNPYECIENNDDSTLQTDRVFSEETLDCVRKYSKSRVCEDPLLMELVPTCIWDLTRSG